MADKTPEKSRPKASDSREDRLKAALKANMARRKAQMRGRAAVESAGDESESKE